jgi:hypothetical protein
MGNALEQRELVLGGSPVYVVAAAGTGKTLLDTLAAK